MKLRGTHVHWHLQLRGTCPLDFQEFIFSTSLWSYTKYDSISHVKYLGFCIPWTAQLLKLVYFSFYQKAIKWYQFSETRCICILCLSWVISMLYCAPPSAECWWHHCPCATNKIHWKVFQLHKNTFIWQRMKSKEVLSSTALGSKWKQEMEVTNNITCSNTGCWWQSCTLYVKMDMDKVHW